MAIWIRFHINAQKRKLKTDPTIYF